MLPPQSADEALFWLGQQEREHLWFMTLGIVDPILRDESARLWQAYEGAQDDAPALLALAPASQDLKRRALEAHRGSWIGFLQPSFYEHCVDEVDRALEVVAFKVPPRERARGWATERSEAAALVAKMLDFDEKASTAEAGQWSAYLRNLAAACKRPSSGNVAPVLYRATADLDGFLASLPARSPSWSLHPRMLAHELREGRRAEAELAKMVQGGAA